jgi:hypothetical protein
MEDVQMKNLIAIILSLITFCATAQIEDINLTNVVDGKIIALKNYSASSGVVVIFTMNNCPFDEYYSGRIKSLAQGKLPVLLVNAHPDANESAENMVKCYKQRGFSIPYLADKEQQLMKGLGATKSTEAFLLKNNNGKLTIAYHGSIDDNPQVASDVKNAYLQEAINKMLAGQTIDKNEVRPVGCSIRKK